MLQQTLRHNRVRHHRLRGIRHGDALGCVQAVGEILLGEQLLIRVRDHRHLRVGHLRGELLGSARCERQLLVRYVLRLRSQLLCRRRQSELLRLRCELRLLRLGLGEVVQVLLRYGQLRGGTVREC